uniref:Uncharacterized protein n=1 Tax=Amphimedon queenslandica TaxID=400682 RepID=A0A1X7U2R1_AMPQE
KSHKMNNEIQNLIHRIMEYVSIECTVHGRFY